MNRYNRDSPFNSTQHYISPTFAPALKNTTSFNTLYLTLYYSTPLCYTTIQLYHYTTMLLCYTTLLYNYYYTPNHSTSPHSTLYSIITLHHYTTPLLLHYINITILFVKDYAFDRNHAHKRLCSE